MFKEIRKTEVKLSASEWSDIFRRNGEVFCRSYLPKGEFEIAGQRIQGEGGGFQDIILSGTGDTLTRLMLMSDGFNDSAGRVFKIGSGRGMDSDRYYLFFQLFEVWGFSFITSGLNGRKN